MQLMLIGILVVMLIDTDEVNAYCYVEYNVSWHTMNDNDDRSEATIIHHGECVSTIMMSRAVGECVVVMTNRR